jgi:hypothetical protein
MVESWEVRHSSSQQMIEPTKGDAALNLNQRTPSFFQSPSLVCMGGLGVLDPYDAIQSVDEEKKDSTYQPPLHGPSRSPGMHITDHVDANSGWGGLGLRGNHSFTNLHRSASGGSGIFIGEDSENEQDESDPNMHKSGSWTTKVGAPDGYIKTSHMANFYYRGHKSASQGDLAKDGDETNNRMDHRGRPLSASMVAG